jgi:hypothetical protein
MLVNAYCTLRSLPPLGFPHVLRSRRDRRDPKLAEHLRGFAGFIMGGGKRPMTPLRYHVLRHIDLVQWQVALEVEDSQRDAFQAWAVAANAIVFLPDATVRDPAGLLLADPLTGDPEAGAELPHPADATLRKGRTEAQLAALGIAVAKGLPPVAGEGEVELRDVADVVARCHALFACALRAESIASGHELPVEKIRARLPAAAAALSAKERSFFEDAAPERQAVVQHVWRYESLAALLWSLGALPDLPLPDALCDVPPLANIMFAEHGAGLAARARLRPPGEILDATDLHLRLHWATTDARVRNAPAPAALEPGVVFERHYALNWLTGFQRAAWDDVDTPT